MPAPIFPEWRKRLNEVSVVFPKWKPLIDIWDELHALYCEEYPTGKAPKLYDRMCSVHDACMDADGWDKTGVGSWTRNNVHVEDEL